MHRTKIATKVAALAATAWHRRPIAPPVPETTQTRGSTTRLDRHVTYESMLDSDGIVRVRPPDNRHDERGCTTRDVLTERWLHLEELRAEVLRMVTHMQTEMDAIEVQIELGASGDRQAADAALITFDGRVVRRHPARMTQNPKTTAAPDRDKP